MEKIKIAQIGTAHDHAAPAMDTLRAASDVFEVLGYAVPDDEEHRFADHYEGVPRMTVAELLALPGLQAVSIETEELHLTKYALMAAEKGLHIHMDKPGGADLAEFEQLIRVIKEKNLVFSTGYMYRHNPAVLELMEKIRAGQLGEIFSVEAHMDCWHPAEKRQWLRQFPGGEMFYLGCHLVDLVYSILGQPLEVIPYNCSTGIDGVTADDYGMAVFRYPNGISFVKTCVTEAGGFKRRQLVVTGSGGSVVLEPLEEGTSGGPYMQTTTGRWVLEDTHNWGVDGVRRTTAPYQRYLAMLLAFAACIRGEKENPWTPDYELAVYRLVLAACGKTV